MSVKFEGLSYFIKYCLKSLPLSQNGTAPPLLCFKESLEISSSKFELNLN